MNKTSYASTTIRRKAYDVNYKVEKGFVHYRDVVDYDQYGERHSGYMVMDLETGYYVNGCYDENYDHLWDLDDVISFLMEKYSALGRDW